MVQEVLADLKREFAATTEEIGAMAWIAAGVLCAFGRFVVVVIGMIVNH